MHPVFEGKQTLLLDMDGTLLDLAYDNFFWQELLPVAYADAHDLPLVAARDSLRAMIAAEAGTLNWYRLDFWSERLKLDILALKASCAERVNYLPGALAFIEAARAQGFRLVLVTNSSRELLQIKDARTQITAHMDAVYSSGDFAAAKESQQFWHRFSEAEQLRREDAVLLDDSASVLRAAQDFGLGGVLGLRKPDSRRAAGSFEDIDSVETVAALLPAD
ncbi:MAG: HAD-IA family hydrolase [Pseudomonadota bacterium]